MTREAKEMQRESDNDIGRFLCNLSKEDYKQKYAWWEKEREIIQPNIGVFSRYMYMFVCESV